MYDLIIVGGGPAGASAAVFAARAGLSTLVLDADKGFTRKAMLYNHLGFPDGITGPELVELGRRHAEGSGAQWIEASVARIEPAEDGSVAVVTESGERYDAQDLLLAVGIKTDVAQEAGITTKDGSEPRIPSVIQVDGEGRTNLDHVWAAGTAGDVSVHTIVTAGDGARVAINIISEQQGERWVDHAVLQAPSG
jgi:thioredoxin reductase (NADPH)